MIFIGGTPSVERSGDMPSEVTTQDLLVACAAAMRRQADAMGKMDVALGKVLEHLRRPALPTGAAASICGSLMRDLQRADRIRQEAEGLAKVLEVVACSGTVEGSIPTDALRGCTPLAELQARLFAGCGSTMDSGQQDSAG